MKGEQAQACMHMMRLDRPIGIELTLLPALWSLAANAWAIPWKEALIFCLGAVLVRGAGCTYNDLVDMKFDAQVARTKSRPLPSGRMTRPQAIVFFVAQLMAAAGLLVFLPLQVFVLSVCAVIGLLIYPWMKRITYWPQLFLGLCFNWGVLMGWACWPERAIGPTLILYAAAVFWTLGYDTIYAHQDRADDLHIGVKSTALLFQGTTKVFLTVTYGAMSACLLGYGLLQGLSAWYFGGLAACVGGLLWQIMTLDQDSPASCLVRFRSNRWIGLGILISLLRG